MNPVSDDVLGVHGWLEMSFCGNSGSSAGKAKDTVSPGYRGCKRMQ